jgi:CRP/FNR family transcriptional regulator
VHNKVKDRVALSLLQLLEEYGMDPDSGCLNISLTREELANIAGTSRETATRILYDFKNRKIIELIGKKIRIQDQKSLEKIAHGDTP